MILGIDPGVNKTGFALVFNGKLFKHKTLSGSEAISYARSLAMAYQFKKCIVERPRLGVLYSRHMTKNNALMSESGRIKLAQNIGQNIQLTNDIVSELDRLGVKTKQVPPARKATKWPTDYWQRIFNWEGRCPSEHARDASVIALQWEKWAGWEFYA